MTLFSRGNQLSHSSFGCFYFLNIGAKQQFRNIFEIFGDTVKPHLQNGDYEYLKVQALMGHFFKINN